MDTSKLDTDIIKYVLPLPLFIRVNSGESFTEDAQEIIRLMNQFSPVLDEFVREDTLTGHLEALVNGTHDLNSKHPTVPDYPPYWINYRPKSRWEDELIPEVYTHCIGGGKDATYTMPRSGTFKLDRQWYKATTALMRGFGLLKQIEIIDEPQEIMSKVKVSVLDEFTKVGCSLHRMLPFEAACRSATSGEKGFYDVYIELSSLPRRPFNKHYEPKSAILDVTQDPPILVKYDGRRSHRTSSIGYSVARI